MPRAPAICRGPRRARKMLSHAILIMNKLNAVGWGDYYYYYLLYCTEGDFTTETANHLLKE